MFIVSSAMESNVRQKPQKKRPKINFITTSGRPSIKKQYLGEPQTSNSEDVLTSRKKKTSTLSLQERLDYLKANFQKNKKRDKKHTEGPPKAL